METIETLTASLRHTSEKSLNEHGIVATLCDNSHFHLVFGQRLDADMQPELEDFSLEAGGQNLELASISLKSGTRDGTGWSLISFGLPQAIDSGTLIHLKYHPRQFFLWSEDKDEPIEGFELHATAAQTNGLQTVSPPTHRHPGATKKHAPQLRVRADAHVISICDHQIRILLPHDLEASVDPKTENFRAESNVRYLNIDRAFFTLVENGCELTLLTRQELEPGSQITVTYKPASRPIMTLSGEELETFKVDAVAKAHHLDIPDNTKQHDATLENIDHLLGLAIPGIEERNGTEEEPDTREKPLIQESVTEKENPTPNVVPLFEEKPVAKTTPQLKKTEFVKTSKLQEVAFKTEGVSPESSFEDPPETRTKNTNRFALLAIGIGAGLIVWGLFATINFFVVLFSIGLEEEMPSRITSQQTTPEPQAQEATAPQPCEHNYKNGAHYKGSCLDGQRHGGGNYTYLSGDKYYGEWSHNSRHGSGMMQRQNGEVYAGGFDNDKMQGKGAYSWPDGRTYEGEFLNDKFHGQGIMIEADGHRFEGRFENGHAVEGTCFIPNGTQKSGPC